MTKDEALWALREQAPVRISPTAPFIPKASHLSMGLDWPILLLLQGTYRVKEVCHSFTKDGEAVKESWIVHVGQEKGGFYGKPEDFYMAFPEGIKSTEEIHRDKR